MDDDVAIVHARFPFHAKGRASPEQVIGLLVGANQLPLRDSAGLSPASPARCSASGPQHTLVMICLQVKCEGIMRGATCQRARFNDYHKGAIVVNDRQFKGEIDRLRSAHRMELLEVPRVVALCREDRAIRGMLDVGTGSGIFAEAFAAEDITVRGVDLRQDMLDAAREFVPGGHFVLGRMGALPFEEESIDLVFLGHVLHEADDMEQALAEAARVARQRVVILEWVYREEDYGPPLDHRVSEETVANSAKPVGFARSDTFMLTHMILYRFDV